MTLPDRITGVLSPVVTPFTPDFGVDMPRFVSHCRWLMSQKCGLALLGTNSEANSLSLEERIAMIDTVVAAGLDPRRMMPGTGCCSIPDTVALTRRAVAHGCAGVLMLPPFYYKGVPDDGLYRYYSEIIERVGDERLRIYLYHIPPVAIVGITPKLIERLLKAYPNAIAGMKDSSGDWNNTKTFLDNFAKSSFDVFVGSESFLLQNMRHGGVGTISATANVNPAAIHALFRDWQEPDAEKKQTELDLVRDTIGKKYLMIAALKQTVAIHASDPSWGRVRPPLLALDADQTASLERELAEIGFTMPGLTCASERASALPQSS
jgi:4-hydroxy-tetrahydrodipicolinate synthase